MFKYTFLFGILMLAVVQQVTAQHDEVCHWQCDIIHCDYYPNYCDYDCYEDCYPFSPDMPLTMNKKFFHGVKSSQRQLDFTSVKGGQATPAIKLRENSRSGKTIRMRIENPIIRNIQGGINVFTRGAPPRALALMQTCLSNKSL